MIIRNNRGFMMAEVIITSVIILLSLTALYVSYGKIYGIYQEMTNYYDVPSLYRLAYYRDYLVEKPDSNETDNLMNVILKETKTDIVKEIYGFNNCIIPDSNVKQIDGYKDKVFLLYDPKKNLNSVNINSILKNNGEDELNVTFQRYIDYLKNSAEFKNDYIFIAERCMVEDNDVCKYAYLDLYDADMLAD